MDIQMPTMDGDQATTAIRALEPQVGRIPIVALTAHAMAGDRQRPHSHRKVSMVHRRRDLSAPR